MREPVLRDVPVDGGALRVADWGGDGPPVLALHGITASSAAWLAVADRLSDVHLVAPDLRGRGGSRELPGPYGMARHAADMVALLDHLDWPAATVVGHSMGGFVTTALATAAPDRIRAAVLVDGGLSLGPQPPDLGPAADRLDMTFADRDAYLDFWRPHPSFAPMWGPEIEAYLDYDLVPGPDGGFVAACRKAAMQQDAADLIDADMVTANVAALTAPTTFLRAVTGFLAAPPPLYPPAVVAEWTAGGPDRTARTVDGTNHYSIVMAEPFAGIVADTVREATR